MSSPWYPVNLRLAGLPCLVVGGGPVAAGKVTDLLAAGAEVTVVAPAVCSDLAELAARGVIDLQQRPYDQRDLEGVWFAVAATGDPAVNAAVRADGDALRVFVNAADDPDHCSAIRPAQLWRGDLLVTYSTGGASPAVSKWLRRRGEQLYGPEYGELVALVAQVRRERMVRNLPTDPRGWQRALDSGILDLVRQGRTSDAKELLDACLSSSSA